MVVRKVLEVPADRWFFTFWANSGTGRNREHQSAKTGRRVCGFRFEKPEILFPAGCPLSMSVFEVRADKCAVHALVSV